MFPDVSRLQWNSPFTNSPFSVLVTFFFFVGRSEADEEEEDEELDEEEEEEELDEEEEEEELDELEERARFLAIGVSSCSRGER